MRLYLFLLFVLTSFHTASAQQNSTSDEVNSFFEFRLDSIEHRIIKKKWDESNYFLYYTVKNISKDTLIYITNSCFYYNHYSLEITQIKFDLNPTGGCVANAFTPYTLAPGESFSASHSIIADNLDSLKTGKSTAMLSVPLVKEDNLVIDDHITYRVDGRDFAVNKQLLIFNGQTKVVETHLNKDVRK